MYVTSTKYGLLKSIFYMKALTVVINHKMVNPTDKSLTPLQIKTFLTYTVGPNQVSINHVMTLSIVNVQALNTSLIVQRCNPICSVMINDYGKSIRCIPGISITKTTLSMVKAWYHKNFIADMTMPLAKHDLVLTVKEQNMVPLERNCTEECASKIQINCSTINTSKYDPRNSSCVWQTDKISM